MDSFNVDYGKIGRVENGDIIPMGSDSEFAAAFHLAKVPNFEGTDYTEVVHLRLQAPGDTKTVYDQPARMESHSTRPSDPERFPRQWADFQRGQSGDVAGTPIHGWAEMTGNDARRFELLGITTVEQLARVSDTNLAGIGMGALALRDKARAHLAGTSGESALLDRMTKMQDVIDMLLAERTDQPTTRKARTPKEAIDA